MATQTESESTSAASSEATGDAPKKKRHRRHNLKITSVPIEGLKPFPGNPRKGNVNEIAKSLKRNGQFKPIVVQKSTNYVLAGNHTKLGAERLSWSHLDAVIIDVDDEEALRIMLADNRTNDLATYDMEALGKILDQVKTDPVGTGYDDDDLKLILAAVESSVEDVDMTNLIHPPHTGEDDEEVLRSFNDADFGEEPDELGITPDPEDEEAGENFEDTSEDLGGVIELKTDVDFPGHGYWGIPLLKKSAMFLTSDLPEKPLLPWAGFATRKWEDPEQWWFYNYGESTSGMTDISKIILAFYCFDDQFEKWWWYPEKYVAKALNSGIKYAVCPNFTASALEPHTLNLYAIFRSRWLGRYMQEAGMKVIPDISWPRMDLEFLEKHVLPSLGTNVPVIASQRQTFDHSADRAYTKSLEDGYRMVVEKLKPETFIVYCSTKIFSWMKSLKLETDLVHVVTRTEMMREAKENKPNNPLK